MRDFPSGYMDKADLLRLYSAYFPFQPSQSENFNSGNDVPFAHHLFRVLASVGGVSSTADKTDNKPVPRKDRITFMEFIHALSVLMRGNLNERVQLAFKLYDIDGNGYITHDEIRTVLLSMYALMGNPTRSFENNTISNNNHHQPMTLEERVEERVKWLLMGSGDDLTGGQGLDPDAFRLVLERDPALLQALCFYDGCVL